MTQRPHLLARALWLAALALGSGGAVGSAWAEEGGAATLPPAGAEAEAAAGKAWRERPQDLALGLRWFDLLLESSRTKDALTAFEEAHRARKDDRVAAFLYGRALGGDRGLDLMREALATGLGRDGETALLARRALAKGEEAEKRWEPASRNVETLALTTGRAADWEWAGWLAEKAGDAPRARVAYEKALAIEPRRLDARDGLALVLVRLGDLPRATALAKETVAAHPASADAHITLGLVLAAAGDSRGARKAWDAALARAGDDVRALVLLGTTYVDLEQFALAHRALDRALELAPLDASVLLAAATLALEEEKPTVARDLLARAARAAPSDARVAFLEGLSAERLANYAGAATAFARAMRLDPRSAEYAAAYALALEAKGDADGALAAFRAALELAPTDANLALRLGWLLEKKKRWKQAEEAYRLAARSAPKAPDPHYFLAVLLGDRMKNPNGAIEELEAYKRLGGAEPQALAWLEELKAAKGK
jgi:tetratricopeptide (TPR) repeat protein